MARITAKGKPIPVRMLFQSDRSLMAELAKAELEGVGQLPSALEQIQVAIHYRRTLTEDEFGQLDPAWCKIRAMDLAGHGKILEENEIAFAR